MTRIICFTTLLLTAAVAANAQSGSWSDTTPGDFIHSSATGANGALSDGRVFFWNEVLSRGSIYNPIDASWRATRSAPFQFLNTYVVLNQKVLFVSGSTYGVYDADSDDWLLGDMLANHGSAVLVSLQDGRALVIGGGTAEAYNPITNTFSFIAPPLIFSMASTGVSLQDGTVLVSHGLGSRGAEVYDPDRNQWARVGDSSRPGGGLIVSLQDGRALMAEKYNYLFVELYDPTTQSWRPTSNQPDPVHFPNFSLNSLPNSGKILLCGGNGDRPIGLCEIYSPMADSWTPTASMRTPRDNFASSTLLDGRVLVAAGNSGCDWDDDFHFCRPIFTNVAEIFTEGN